MPKGAIVYAGNNSRLKSFSFRDTSGKLLGFLATDKLGNLIAKPIAKGNTNRRYTVNAFFGAPFEIDAPASLNKAGSEAKSPTTGAVIGNVKKEQAVDANGTIKVRNDSGGMFAAVALKMKKLYSLPSNLVKPFSNVHDDFADGGTEADSRKSFFDTLKSVPGPGGASDLDFFAYSGHGGANSLPSAGISRSHLGDVAKEIKRLVRSDGTVIFYACQTGSPNGFAQKLSGLLPAMTVFGHLKSGPGSTNPYKVKYKNGEPQKFLEDLTPAQQKTWANYLNTNPDFYARYPFMTMEQIKAEVGI